MTKRARLRIGDVFEISLSDRRKAYGQYVFWDKKMGPLVKIFNTITDHEMKIDELKGLDAMFSPVITGLFAAIRSGYWNVIGNIPVENFVYPNYISTFFDDKTGKARDWYLWDGSKSIKLGKKLTRKQKKLEYLIVWPPQMVVHRIETGQYPFPYRELIENNQFSPRR